MSYTSNLIIFYVLAFRILNALDCHVCNGGIQLAPPIVKKGVNKVIENLEKIAKKTLENQPHNGKKICTFD